MGIIEISLSRYKVGDSYTTTLDKMVVNLYNIGDKYHIFIGSIKSCTCLIDTKEGNVISGKIITTYGHKRRNK